MKKAHTPNKTRIKIVCYYSHRRDGTPYTHAEKLTGGNRRVHDIYDVILTENERWQRREDLAVKKAVKHFQLHASKIISGLIIMNNWKTEEEWTIGKFKADAGLQFTPPDYSTDEKGNVWIKKVTTLKVDKMKGITPYDPAKEKRTNSVDASEVGRLMQNATFNVTVKGS